MRSTPYPVPPSKTWTSTALATYGALAVAGGIVLLVLATSPQQAEGVLVLGLWGGLTLVSSLACVYGVARDRYRWEWMGCWGIVAGTSVYLAVTILGAINVQALLSNLPVLLGSWGAVAVPLALIALYGAARSKRRWKRAGLVGLAVVTALLAAAAMAVGFGAAAPTILMFVYAIGRTLGRAIVLSLIDLHARHRVIESRTGEIPEVAVDE